MENKQDKLEEMAERLVKSFNYHSTVSRKYLDDRGVSKRCQNRVKQAFIQCLDNTFETFEKFLNGDNENE